MQHRLHGSIGTASSPAGSAGIASPGLSRSPQSETLIPGSEAARAAARAHLALVLADPHLRRMFSAAGPSLHCVPAESGILPGSAAAGVQSWTGPESARRIDPSAPQPSRGAAHPRRPSAEPERRATRPLFPQRRAAAGKHGSPELERRFYEAVERSAGHGDAARRNTDGTESPRSSFRATAPDAPDRRENRDRAPVGLAAGQNVRPTGARLGVTPASATLLLGWAITIYACWTFLSGGAPVAVSRFQPAEAVSALATRAAAVIEHDAATSPRTSP